MTYPGGDPLAGLDATPEERLEFYRALDEVEAEERGVDLDAPPDYGDELPEAGPWDDTSAQLGAAGAALDARHELDGTRIGEDIVAELDRRPTDEQRLARAMPRIEAGTYTQDSYWRGDETAAAAARDPLGRYAAACGPLDDFARCSARYHTPDCHTTTESAAARGSAGEATAWADTLAGRTPHAGIDASALGLANEPQPGDGLDAWADLITGPGGPGSADPELHARMLVQLGETDQLPDGPREPLPDTTVLRAILGI